MAGCAIEEPHRRRGKTGDERGPLTPIRRWLHAWLAFGIVMLMLASVDAHAARRPPASYKVDIEATPRSLRKLLEAHLDVARFAKRPDISDDQFEFLITATPQQVRDLAATQGYFSPVVRTDVRTVDDQKRVTVSVDPGPQTLITSISLSFRGPVLTEDPAQENAARFAFSLHEGDPFSQGDWDDAKNASLKALQSRRYLGAKIYHSEARIDPRTHEAKLSVTYESGPTFTMGKLDVSGTRRYPEQIVDNVNPISEGDIYDVQRIAELQRQLQNTPYYASVAIDVDSDPAKPVETPMHVKVSEYPYNSIRGGVGYSTDNGPLIQGSYSYLDTFGKAWPFTVEGRIDQIQQYGQIQLAMPPGREVEARRFYADTLGIPEVPKPPELAKRGGCWFERGTLKVHLGVEADFHAAKKAHPAFIVEDLDALMRALTAGGYKMKIDEPLEGYTRIYADDPFGNRIELMEPK